MLPVVHGFPSSQGVPFGDWLPNTHVPLVQVPVKHEPVQAVPLATDAVPQTLLRQVACWHVFEGWGQFAGWTQATHWPVPLQTPPLHGVPDVAGAPPPQIPAWQVSPCVHSLPSLHVDPSALAG